MTRKVSWTEPSVVSEDGYLLEALEKAALGPCVERSKKETLFALYSISLEMGLIRFELP